MKIIHDTDKRERANYVQSFIEKCNNTNGNGGPQCSQEQCPSAFIPLLTSIIVQLSSAAEHGKLCPGFGRNAPPLRLISRRRGRSRDEFIIRIILSDQPRRSSGHNSPAGLPDFGVISADPFYLHVFGIFFIPLGAVLCQT